MPDFSNLKLLVTGASGNLGRAAVEFLLDKGAGKVVAGTRHPDRLGDLKARGVEIRHLDFDDEDGMVAALADVDRVLFVSSDVLDLEGTRLAQHRRVASALTRAKVQHVVYTSYVGASPERGLIQNDHYWTEHALASGPFGFTFLRNQPYADFMIGGIAEIVASGERADATGDRPRGYVMRADCARAAAGALLHADGRRIHDVTGPEAITASAIAAVIAEATGKPVRRLGLTADALRDRLAGTGMPGFFADAFVSFDVDAAEGYHAIVSPAVELFSGRAPESVLDFLRRNIGRV